MNQEDKQRIVAALGSSVEEIRYQAARRLTDVFETPPIEHLVAALGDESWRVRKCASEIMAGLEPGAGLLDALRAALADQDNAGLRNSATEVLVRIGSPAVPVLVQVLRDGDKDERKLAADILGDIKDTRALDPLLERLGDPDENVRAAAAEALGMLGDPLIAPKLIALLGDEGVIVQLSCLDALDRLDTEVPADVLIGLLDTVPLRPHLYRLLGKLRDERVVPALLDGLQARGRMERGAAACALEMQARLADRQRRVQIQIEVARVASDRVVDNLCAMLESPAEDERRASVLLLGWTGRVETVQPLLRAASDERLRDGIEAAVRAIGPRAAGELAGMLDELGRIEKVLAVELLGVFGLQAGASSVIELALSEESEVAEAAQLALGEAGYPSIVSTLAEMFRRDPERPQAGVVASLIKLGTRFQQEVKEAVSPLLDEDRPALRVAAAQVLCEIARKTELDMVARLVGDGDPDIRMAAVRAMGRVGGDESVERLRTVLTDESSQVRAAAARALGRRDSPEARKILEVALNDSDSRVVRSALAALGESGALEGAEALLPFLKHPEGDVALEAVRALNHLGWRQDAAVLREASRHADPEVVKEVLAGCAQWPVEQIRPILFDALENQHWDVRMAAVKRIGTLHDPAAVQAVFDRSRTEKDDLVRETMEQVLRMQQRGSDGA